MMTLLHVDEPPSGPWSELNLVLGTSQGHLRSIKAVSEAVIEFPMESLTDDQIQL